MKTTIHSLVERIFHGDPRAELQLKKRIAAVVYRYPPADYSMEGKWNPEIIEQICNNVWETMIQRGLNRFWYLSGADARRVKFNFKKLVFNVMLKTATPEQRDFINTVVKTYRINKKLFTKKRVSGRTLMGMTKWLKQNRANCMKTQEQLLQIWREKIKWPDMAKERVSRPDRCHLFKQMLETIMEWVIDAHFYNGYRKLINFPRPGISIKLDEDDHDSVNLDQLLGLHDRDRENIDAFNKASAIIAENKTFWQQKITEVFSTLKDEERKFLYYLCHYGMCQSHAAQKVGRTPAFATATKNRLNQRFSDLREHLAPEDLPAMSRFLAENLKSLLEGKIE